MRVLTSLFIASFWSKIRNTSKKDEHTHTKYKLINNAVNIVFTMIVVSVRKSVSVSVLVLVSIV